MNLSYNLIHLPITKYKEHIYKVRINLKLQEMKQITSFFLVVLTTIALSSCGSSIKSYDDANAFKALKKELDDKFGADAYYTDIAVMNMDETSTISATVTTDPTSLKMAEWMKYDGKWDQKADVKLEISGETDPTNFMFQLDKNIDIELFGRLVDEAKQKVITEKEIEEVTLVTALVNAPDDGDFSKTRYFIVIQPKHGGTRFSFWYKLDGTLDKFKY